jgi:hypothetical protein
VAAVDAAALLIIAPYTRDVKNAKMTNKAA